MMVYTIGFYHFKTWVYNSLFLGYVFVILVPFIMNMYNENIIRLQDSLLERYKLRKVDGWKHHRRKL